MTRNLLSGLAAAAFLAVGLTAACAQNYPSKTVTFITGAAAGNAPDVVGRLVGDRLSQIWKQPVVILNRPGAGGMIALQGAADADKDGHTLYLLGSSTFTILPVTQEGRMPIDVNAGFIPIGIVAEQPIAVGVNKDVPAMNMQELLALIKSSADGMMFAGSFRGSSSHLSGELIRERTQAKITFIHAAGAAASVNDVIGGRIPIMIDGLATQGPGVQNGGIRLLAIGSAERLPNLPELPTIGETIPGLTVAGWTILAAPTGTSQPVIEKINADLRKVVAMPDVVARFQALGGYPRDLSPEQTKEYIQNDEQLWRPLARRVLQ